jgi:hypothetical protein
LSPRSQLHVDLNTNLWHCFGDCNRGGAQLEFVAEMERVSIRDAALMITGWYAIAHGTPTNQHSKRRSNAMAGEKPTMKAFVVEGEGDDAFWVRCGSAWPHKDGKGLNVQISSGLAVSGRLVLREYTEDDHKQEEQQKAKRKK